MQKGDIIEVDDLRELAALDKTYERFLEVAQ